MLKRLFITLLALLTLCACQTQEPDFTETVMVVNPFSTHKTLAEAEKAADITLTLPEDLASCGNITYRAANNDTLQLVEVICELNEGNVCIRKGISEEDISGVYIEFAVCTEYCGDDFSFTVYGYENKEHLAVWTRDSYRYSIYAEQGMESGTLQDWVYAVK